MTTPRRTVRRRPRLLALAAAALALAGCTSSAGSREAGYVAGAGTLTRLTSAQRGAPVEFTGTTLDGRPFALASTRGHVTVLNVWASWCPPCRAEAPGLARAADALRPQGVRFVGINTRDEPAQARAYVRRFGLPFPSVVDEAGSVMLTFRETLPPTAIPSTLVLDRSGRMAVRIVGGVTETRLRQAVDQVLAEGRARPGAAR
jgi:thiol-disulfide isomerase/thioredoxin